MPKPGRNHPCPCGKTKPDGTPVKHKHCCGAVRQSSPSDLPPGFFEAAQREVQKLKAKEIVRERQQGLGKPIIEARFQGQQVIAIGNQLVFGDWRTFPDFLQDYIKQVLDIEWMRAELDKPTAERHPVMQWAVQYAELQKQHGFDGREVKSAPTTGIVASYLILAYNLYLISHNVELQAHLINRLKDPRNFQGAYYELMVAGVLIRAGFKLTLIDESDRASKNCEFSAVSGSTGKKYWVEAKMKSVNGLFGKDSLDGSPNPNPLSHLITHVHGAMTKAAEDERLIFVDLNAGLPSTEQEVRALNLVPSVEAKLTKYESVTMPKGERAYVFVTCTSFQHDPSGPARLMVAPYGLGIPDFNTRGVMTLADRYRQNQRHKDAIAIGRALENYLEIPSTFDASPPSRVFRAGSSVTIGEMFEYELEGQILSGTVVSATANARAKVMFVSVAANDQKIIVVEKNMTDDQAADYEKFGDAMFGIPRGPQPNMEDHEAFFEWFVEANRGTPRERMLEWFGQFVQTNKLNDMSDEDMLIEYCGSILGVMIARDGNPGTRG